MARPRTVPDHVCPVCRGRYRPRNRDQIYCSRECRIAAKHPMLADSDSAGINLREEIEAHRRERATAPLYRYWWRHV